MQVTCFIFLWKFIEMFWSYKNCQKIGVRRGLGGVRRKKFACPDNPG